MNAQTCRDILKRKSEPLLLIDVRETDEVVEEPYFVSPNPSYLNIPLSLLGMLPKEELIARLEEAANRLGKPLSEVKLVVACRSGGRSRVAQEHLASFGIKSENLDGGRIVWGEAI